MALVKVFSGSEILAQGLQARIEAVGVSVTVKNNIQSSTASGISSLGQAQAVEVFIEERDKEKAAQAIEDFKMGN